MPGWWPSHFGFRRLSLLLAVSGFIALMLFITVWFDTGEAPMLAGDRDRIDTVDFYVVEPRSVDFDGSGVPIRRFSADRLKHYRQSGTAEIVAPRFTLYNLQERDWRASARLGRALDGAEQVDLEGDVLVQDTDEAWVLRTETLSLFPDAQKAATAAPVEIRSPFGVTTAVGLEAELASERVQLLDNVRGRYVVE